MLSGVRIGKKKRKKQDISTPAKEDSDTNRASLSAPKIHRNNNLDAAASLRAQLSSSSSLKTIPTATSQTLQQRSIRSEENILPYEKLIRKGRINSTNNNDRSEKEDDTIVLTGVAAERNLELEREDLRVGRRKGIKRKKNENDDEEQQSLTIEDMVKAEKSQGNMDEIYARNILRMGGYFKGKELKNGSTTGADEDDYTDMSLYQKQNLTKVASAQRERQRQIVQHDIMQQYSKKCWWWMSSPSFPKHRLIALGNHTSLVMAAPSSSLMFAGKHFYIVPLQHYESLVSIDDANVWNEIILFQRSLRTLFSKENEDVVFMETYYSTQKGFWQLRFEAISIPKEKNDAQIYFKQAMLEHAEEWGTHTNRIYTVKGNNSSALRTTIPNQKFSYFYIDFGDTGYAQIIEDIHRFPNQFGIHTIAGMLEIDRLGQKKKHYDERSLVLQFLEKWKSVDWTLQLD